MKQKTIILASASPRRRELLSQIGLEFQVLVSNVEETVTTQIPEQAVEELSRQKAEATLRLFKEQNAKDGDSSEAASCVVIGADTVVACNGEILGKPRNKQAAFDMLLKIQGRTHQVYTGVTILNLVKDKLTHCPFHEVTGVTFYPMTQEEIWEYVDTLDPLDKAGAYGIQGFCARYISEIKGDYNNVVGLPVGRLYQELKKLPE